MSKLGFAVGIKESWPQQKGKERKEGARIRCLRTEVHKEKKGICMPSTGLLASLAYLKYPDA